MPFCWKLFSPQNLLAANCVQLCLFEQGPGMAGREQPQMGLGKRAVPRLPEQQQGAWNEQAEAAGLGVLLSSVLSGRI